MSRERQGIRQGVTMSKTGGWAWSYHEKTGGWAGSYNEKTGGWAGSYNEKIRRAVRDKLNFF